MKSHTTPHLDRKTINAKKVHRRDRQTNSLLTEQQTSSYRDALAHLKSLVTDQSTNGRKEENQLMTLST